MRFHPKKARGGILRAACGLGLLIALISSLAAAAEVSQFGVNAHVPGGADLKKLFKQTKKARIGWVRIDFVWALVEPVKGQRDWRLYDAIVAEAKKKNLKILANIAYTPDWATDGPEFSGVPRNKSDWYDFCHAAARRYRRRIKNWEVWNEPNQPHFWAGTRAEYLEEILEPAAKAIHRAHSSLRVGGPGLAHLIAGDKDWYRWLQETLDKQGHRLDFVTHHVYDSEGHGGVTEDLADSTLFGEVPELWDIEAPSVLEVLTAEGFEDHPFWLTETGWASDNGGARQQAENYTGFLEEWFTDQPDRGWIQRIFFYELQDDPRDGIPKWGILTSEIKRKKAYRAYRKFIRENG